MPCLLTAYVLSLCTYVVANKC